MAGTALRDIVMPVGVGVVANKVVDQAVNTPMDELIEGQGGTYSESNHLIR